MGYLIFYSGFSGCSGLLDPGLWVWGVCCAGILSVDHEFLLFAASCLGWVGCVVAVVCPGFVALNPFVEGEQLLGRSVEFFLSTTLSVMLSGFVSASVEFLAGMHHVILCICGGNLLLLVEAGQGANGCLAGLVGC